MTDEEFRRDYIIPTMIEWSGHSTTNEEFRFWCECNNFSIDKGMFREWGMKVWSRSHKFKDGELVFLIGISKDMMPLRYYDMMVRYQPSEGDEEFLSNAYENINLSMAMLVNAWNRRIWLRKNGFSTPLIPAHWMTPTVNFEKEE
jgi:hypothetical protein